MLEILLKMKKIIILQFLFVSFFAFSQQYQLLDTTDYEKRKALITKFEKEHKFLKKTLKKNTKVNLEKK